MAAKKKSENSTRPTHVDPEAFVAAVEHETRRADAHVLMEMMHRATGCPPKMWGPSIVGFGRYRYRYETGREGESMLTGFSPRKAKSVVYILPGYDDISDDLEALGKHSIGKSCLYINKLDDIDLDVLEKIIADSVAKMRASHETFDE